MENVNDIITKINQGNLVKKTGEVYTALLNESIRRINYNANALPEDRNEQDRYILNSLGPAATDSLVEHAIVEMRRQGKLGSLILTNNMAANVRMIQNFGGEEAPAFSNVLRQFLLPRYAYLDFDTVIDPRHHIDTECGYPKFITPIMYRYMYDRDDVARRVVDLYPDETWSEDPIVTDTDDETEMTPFKEDWQMLCEDHNVLQMLYRINRLAGIGHYGALLLGVGDGADLEKPIDEPDLLMGKKRTRSLIPRDVLFMRPFDEYLSFIHMYETDVLHPRYGLPKFYNLIFLDMTIDAAGASIGTRLNRRVHWTRVVHVPSDSLQSSLVFATPCMQPVFNRLLDLRKIKGGSAEMFWKGAFPGLSFEAMPGIIDANPEYDKDEFKEMLERYSGGLQRYLDTVGLTVKSLAPQVADPEKHVRVQLEAIAMAKNCPFNVFMGSEQGRVAGSESKTTWNQRLGKTIKRHTIPYVLRNCIDRFLAIGWMRPPKNDKYYVGWPDFHTVTDEDRANLALKWTQALAQYVAGGLIHFIAPLDYMTQILGIKPKQAILIDAYMQETGGYKTLRDVDPSEQAVAGTNGVRKNTMSKGAKEGTTSERPKPRDTSDKKIEGSSG